VRTAFSQDHPFAIHYPRDPGLDLPPADPTPIPVGQGELLREGLVGGADLVFVAFGPIVQRALAVADALERDGWRVAVVNARFARPLDSALLTRVARGARLLVTFEESIVTGGFGSAVLETLAAAGIDDPDLLGVPVRIVGIPADRFVDHGAVTDLRRTLGLDVDGLERQVRETLARLGLNAPALGMPVEARVG
jgi:1-deoxy-D-xylulose-5-phosphate synthase